MEVKETKELGVPGTLLHPSGSSPMGERVIPLEDRGSQMFPPVHSHVAATPAGTRPQLRKQE